MSYAPCKNPSCKSYGQPHPNCRCYGAMADGGEVSFCSIDRAHNPECEYFARGGDVIDPSQVQIEGTSNQYPAIDPTQVQLDRPKINPSEVEIAPSKYETPMQKLGTAAEGLAQGIAGPLATLAETKILGIPKEDIVGRKEANPWIHGIAEASGLVGGMLTGTGEAALAAKAAARAAEIANAGKIGSALIKGAISNGLVQAGDEVSQWLLGQGNPEDGIGAKLAHVGAAGLFGAAFGGAGESASAVAKKSLEKIAESKFGEKASYFLYGLAAGAKGETETAGLDVLSKGAKKAYESGLKYYNALSGNALPPAVAAAYEGYHGYQEGGVEGALVGAGAGLLHGLAFDLARKPVAALGSKYVAPAVLKVLSGGNINGALEAFDHAADMAQGSKAISKGIEHLFGTGAIGAQQMINAYYSKKSEDKLDKYLKDGGIDQEIQQQIYDQNSPAPQGFAEGGAVAPSLSEPNGLETHYPEQNILFNAAKGRVSNYLNSLRPVGDASKLAFDDEPDQRGQEKSYRRALTIAVNPLSVLDEIKKGTVEPEHVRHLNELYPELSGLLQKKITERVVAAQLNGEKPPYSVRQGLSMFMGTPLSGELVPQNIQAAQNVFQSKAQAQQAAPQQAPKRSSGSKNALSKSDQAFLTSPQARQARAQEV